MVRIASALLAVALLGGCGQKGPLVLAPQQSAGSGQSSQKQSTARQSSPSSTNDANDRVDRSGNESSGEP